MGKEFIKNLKGEGINEYKMIKIDKDALKKNILKIRYNNDTNLLISSYLAGNTSTDLYNTINKNLYNKLKNNELSKRSYHNIFKKINNNI